VKGDSEYGTIELFIKSHVSLLNQPSDNIFYKSGSPLRKENGADSAEVYRMKLLWGYFKEVFLESTETEVEVKKERKLFSKTLLKIEEIYESNTTMKELISST